ncbi:PAS domain S-box protein [Chloroflexota bacterium]
MKISLTSRLKKIIKNPGFWLVVALVILISYPQYRELYEHPHFITTLFTNLGLDRHAFERILYLAPIVWAGFIFSWRGAFITSVAALLLMIPRIILFSQYKMDAIFETGAIFVIGNVLAISFEALKKERGYRSRLEETEKELLAYVEVTKASEKRLSALNHISRTISDSLELNQVLNSAMDSIIDVMQVDVVLIFLLDKKHDYLNLKTYRGISEDFAKDVDKLKIGEGFNGRVAETGEPLFVEEASKDPRLTRKSVSIHEIRSEIIVPLKLKEKVIGTLCVAMHSHRIFKTSEVELLTALGDQIGVATENAHLYQLQWEIARELKTSEERYRELFENAHDAIWLEDTDNNIIAANNACSELTGYRHMELLNMKCGQIFDINQEHYGEIHQLENQDTGRIIDVKIIKKDGGTAYIQLSSSLISHDGIPAGIQHIARDISEQKRMQENMTYYLHQATRAQEEERKRISRELHDETVQELVVLSRQIDMLSSNIKHISEEERLRFDKIIEQVQSIMQGVRRLSQNLRPDALDRLGLLPALQWLANDVSSYSKIGTSLKVTGTEHRFAEEVELVLFRITQEALRNAWHHSGATKIAIEVDFRENKTRINIIDNGKGFHIPGQIGDLAREGKLGLAGMQERARLIVGSLSIHSEPGQGTTVTIEIPA